MELEQWPRATPVRITGYTWDVIRVLVVMLEKDGHVGRGEAGGVYYLHDTPASMHAQIEALRPVIEAGIDRDALREVLPPGGARNALDCALWDLEAKLTGRAAWKIAGLEEPRPLVTAFTCHADAPEQVAAKARAFKGAKAIKLKLTGEPLDAERVRAVRQALPEVWLGIDANQGFTRESLALLMPTLLEMRVSLIEQPFPIGKEDWLDGLQSPIPMAADESVRSPADLSAAVGRFDVINIKLDKCGGLTEGLTMARLARDMGFDLMVGNMSGTSLAMAPAFLLGQGCSIVDLDGPALLKKDRTPAVEYVDGTIRCSTDIWG
jgi:L-alanine-DL-glutamate epimerase-like enolase superfamily enzyme